ncbi:alpha/beta hydrolase [Mycobacterium sp. 236(2023)]|uniref:alpha/beta fold hydrolase n=1 Tax=Mycobacterium sp. 236(2023) TaxID=3038163 RepID=UPI0024157368|nr:alpha/beta hydrolase [Mycobacterium sp. 236(2023)]MDG4667246.1 alpha/beta hydrolase [Mycobacterium sp. 236(2023)]
MPELNARLARPHASIAFADSGGTGTPVVLIHGAGADHSIFEAQATALVQRGFRVIAWDLRGHGQSTLAEGVLFTGSDALADMRALLGECNVNRPVLVGHSLGGNMAQTLAHDHPELVSAVVVMDSTWNTGPLTKFERLSLRLAAPLLSLIPAGRLPNVLARASAVTPDAVERAATIFAHMPKRRFIQVWRATISFIEPQPQLRFPVPLALVRGAEDRTGNIADAMPRWAAADRVREQVIPHAGHLVTWDAPDQTSRTLIHILEDWNMAPAE